MGRIKSNTALERGQQMTNETNNNTTDGINFDVMIADLKSSLERQAEWLDQFGPNNGVVCVSDGDFLLSVNGKAGPYARMEKLEDGINWKHRDNTYCMEEATTMSKVNAMELAHKFNAQHPDRKEKAQVIKFGHAKQFNYEHTKRVISMLEKAQAEYLSRTADEC